MTILFLTNIPSPNRVAFFNELGKLCELTVTFELQRSSERNKAWVGEQIEFFKPIYLKGKQTAVDAAFCPEILRLIHEKWDYIIVSTYNTPTSMLAMQYLMMKEIPYWIEADGGFVKPDSRLKYQIKKHFISHADGWLSTGRMTTEYLCHYGAKKKKCYMFPFTSIRENDIVEAMVPLKDDRVTAKIELGICEKYAVLYLDDFNRDDGSEKECDILMKIAKEFNDNDVGFYVIVDKITEKLAEWKESKGLSNVHYVSIRTNKESVKYYIAADIFAMPSWKNKWMCVVNEAMAAALPVIADRRIEQVERFRDDQTGIAICNDAGEVIKSINAFLEDEKLRFNCGEKSYWSYLSYTLKDMSDDDVKTIGGIKGQIRKYAKKRLELEHTFIFLCVSQIIYRKGIDVLLKAVRDLTDIDFHVCIVGGNATEDMNYDKAHITFYGFKSRSELQDFYRAANVFVLPTREDIWGLVINEAMSFGLPVITTDRCVAGLELIDGNGKIIKVGSNEELANAMKMYLKRDKGHREECQSLKNVRKYTLENMAKTHIQILKNVNNY